MNVSECESKKNHLNLPVSVNGKKKPVRDRDLANFSKDWAMKANTNIKTNHKSVFIGPLTWEEVNKENIPPL